jgi:magnesium-protoporphyrin IX monomethyl ester (oxidative) cyclase
MSYFENVCLLKAPQAFDIPHAQDVSDLTEICYLAGMIEKDVKSVSIPIDFYSIDPYEDFRKYLRENPTDLVGISSMTGAFNNALKLAQLAKSFDKYVVMGGYHPTALYEDVLKSPHVDAVIVGEGEATLQDFVRNGPSNDVSGLAFKENGGITFTGIRPTIRDLDAIPHPLRKARPMRFGEAGDDYSIDTIYTSRGCPWTCTFCANDMVNKKWRGRSPENVVEELAMIHDPERKKLLKIWDANFLTNVKRVEKICDLMIERGLTNFKIWTETRAGDIVRAEGIMEKLYRVGLRNVSLGIESPNEETLKLMKKKNTADDVKKSVEIMNRNKIKGQGYFIIGHYSETAEDTMRYPEYAEAIGLRHAIFMVMTPYPGTGIFREYRDENKIKSFDWDLYNNFCVVVETKGMDTETLNKMFAYCYGRFYTKYSFLNQKKSFAMAIPLLQQLMLLDTIYKLKERFSDAEIENFLFEFLAANNGRKIDRPYPMRPPLLLRWFKKLTIRFTHSAGKNVDLLIEQERDSRHLSISENQHSGSVSGVTLALKDLIDLGKKISPEKAVLIACKLEPIKNNPRRRAQNILSLIQDRDFLASILRIGWFFTKNGVKGVISVLLHSIRNGTFPDKTGLKHS